MKPHPKKAYLLALAAVIGAMLAACGGGGGDDPSDAGVANGDPIDKYIGTITSDCQKVFGVVDEATGAAIYQVLTKTLSKKVSATKVTGSNEFRYFDTINCGGNARYTLTLNSSDNYLEVTGETAVGGKTVDKVKAGTGAYFPDISFGTSLTLKGLKFTGVPFNQRSPRIDLDLLFIDASGNVYIGDFSQPRDADGYPSALQSSPVAKKS